MTHGVWFEDWQVHNSDQVIKCFWLLGSLLTAITVHSEHDENHWKRLLYTIEFRRHSHYLDIGSKRFVLFSTPHFFCKHVEKQALQLSVQVLNISCSRVMIECFVENIIDKTMWKQQFLGSNSSGNLFQMFCFPRFVFFDVFKSLLMQSDRTWMC